MSKGSCNLPYGLGLVQNIRAIFTMSQCKTETNRECVTRILSFFFSFFFFTLSSHLLPLIFSFALICYFDYFGQFEVMILDQKTLLLSVWFDLPFSTKYTCT